MMRYSPLKTARLPFRHRPLVSLVRVELTTAEATGFTDQRVPVPPQTGRVSRNRTCGLLFPKQASCKATRPSRGDDHHQTEAKVVEHRLPSVGASFTRHRQCDGRCPNRLYCPQRAACLRVHHVASFPCRVGFGPTDAAIVMLHSSRRRGFSFNPSQPTTR